MVELMITVVITLGVCITIIFFIVKRLLKKFWNSF